MDKKIRVRVPREVKIGVLDYQVILRSTLKFKDDCLGSIYHDTGILAIDLNQRNVERVQTLLHEVIEAIKRNYNIQIDHLEIDRLAFGFAEFLLENMNLEFDWSGIPEK